MIQNFFFKKVISFFWLSFFCDRLLKVDFDIYSNFVFFNLFFLSLSLSCFFKQSQYFQFTCFSYIQKFSIFYQTFQIYLLFQIFGLLFIILISFVFCFLLVIIVYLFYYIFYGFGLMYYFLLYSLLFIYFFYSMLCFLGLIANLFFSQDLSFQYSNIFSTVVILSYLLVDYLLVFNIIQIFGNIYYITFYLSGVIIFQVFQIFYLFITYYLISQLFYRIQFIFYLLIYFLCFIYQKHQFLILFHLLSFQFYLCTILIILNFCNAYIIFNKKRINFFFQIRICLGQVQQVFSQHNIIFISNIYIYIYIYIYIFYQYNILLQYNILIFYLFTKSICIYFLIQNRIFFIKNY
ncbi:hypothetical protein IMG5_015140 [Ichthyophthirius multifiliis]|uniref:Transmembrane protein n=1 Tax=Ichthyophthirius multifiliis TaxID=5932 RepID=G0QKA5_ICHMU|nr:hypothetical protein IMG5_015140 [Ichthyophthirius multifiliis]EGR34347.1 hypothetical protein IMG5_015140 [Ichthyophthirius multifiliis]|eukprot:XP_004039651.1 hypothetical protein IMG5_015140 [Ichthyophthirius multifiliis]